MFPGGCFKSILFFQHRIFQMDHTIEETDAELRRAAADAHDGLACQKAGRDEWRLGTMKLARALLRGRELCQGDDGAFGRWIKANNLEEIKADDREALLNIARHPEISEGVLAKTERTSVRLIWLKEIKPAFRSAAEGVSSNAKSARRGNPTKEQEKIRPVIRQKVEAGERIDHKEIMAEFGVSDTPVRVTEAYERGRKNAFEEARVVIEANKLSVAQQKKLDAYRREKDRECEVYKQQLAAGFEAAVNERVKELSFLWDKRDHEVVEQANYLIEHCQGRWRNPFKAAEYMVLMKALHPDSTNEENRMAAFKLVNSKKLILRDEGRIELRGQRLPKTPAEWNAALERARQERRAARAANRSST
jgi:hypothetical protein